MKITFMVFTIVLLCYQSYGQKPRARDLGVPFNGTTGIYNAITDVKGVEVGYSTIISGHGENIIGKGPIRTGVTAIFPIFNLFSAFKMYYALTIGLLLILTGCNKMSQLEKDTSAGLNGGFEISKNGLPVNWLMYTPTTVPNADFVIELDTGVFKEGNQSLKFDVKKCSSTGGWHSPGFTNEFFEIGKFKGEGVYKISFWIKNNGAKYRINAGGVSPLEGDMNNLVESSEQIEDWKYFEYEINIPQERHLRLELNILQPGTFWIDDILINKI